MPTIPSSIASHAASRWCSEEALPFRNGTVFDTAPLRSFPHAISPRALGGSPMQIIARRIDRSARRPAQRYAGQPRALRRRRAPQRHHLRGHGRPRRWKFCGLDAEDAAPSRRCGLDCVESELMLPREFTRRGRGASPTRSRGARNRSRRTRRRRCTPS